MQWEEKRGRDGMNEDEEDGEGSRERERDTSYNINR